MPTPETSVRPADTAADHASGHAVIDTNRDVVRREGASNQVHTSWPMVVIVAIAFGLMVWNTWLPLSLRQYLAALYR